MTEMSYAPGAISNKSSKSAFHKVARTETPRKKNPPPYSMRFTWEERERLTRYAGKQSWAAYIRRCVFAENTSKRRKSQVTSADMQAIAQLGSLLGQSRIPNNLNQIARAANTGCLVMDVGMTEQLNEACQHISHIRQILMTALNVRERNSL